MNKNIINIFIAIFISTLSFAQNGINYKAVIKDNLGNVVSDQTIDVQFIIYKGAALTNNVYQESHTLNTDSNGILIANIGEGTTSDVFADINWEDDDHFLNVQVDIGTGLVDLGTIQFMHVPYALSANKAYEADRVLKIPEPFILGVSTITSNARFNFNGKYGWQAAQEMCKAAYPNDPNVRAFTLEQIGQAIVLGNWDTNNMSNIENLNFWGIAPNAVGTINTNEAHRNNAWGLNVNTSQTSNGVRGRIIINSGNVGGINTNDANPLNTYLEVNRLANPSYNYPCMCGTFIN
jgi:hypothetical protein